MPLPTNTNRVLLASAARTVATASAKQQDMYARALRLYLSITANSGTGGLQVVFRGYDRVSGTPVALSSGGMPASQTGVWVYEMYTGALPGQIPGDALAFGQILDVCPRPVPYQWDAFVRTLDGSSYTYSLSAELITL